MKATAVYIVFAAGIDGGQAHRVVCGLTLFARAVHVALDLGATQICVVAPRGALPNSPRTDVAMVYDAVLPTDASPDLIVTADLVAGRAIIDDATAKLAGKALLRSCRRAYDGIADRYVIRYVSLALTSVLCRLPVTPNQVTAANIIVGLAACAAATVGSAPWFVIAGVLMFLQVVLDSSDGELARLTFQRSRLGMIADNVGDDVIDTLFTAALGLGLGGWWLPLGLAGAAARAFYAVTMYWQLWRSGHPGDVMAFHWWFDGPAKPTERFAQPVTLLTVLRGFGRRDLYCLTWSLTCVLGLPHGALLLATGVVAFPLLGLSILQLWFARGGP